MQSSSPAAKKGACAWRFAAAVCTVVLLTGLGGVVHDAVIAQVWSSSQGPFRSGDGLDEWHHAALPLRTTAQRQLVEWRQHPWRFSACDVFEDTMKTLHSSAPCHWQMDKDFDYASHRFVFSHIMASPQELLCSRTCAEPCAKLANHKLQRCCHAKLGAGDVCFAHTQRAWIAHPGLQLAMYTYTSPALNFSTIVNAGFFDEAYEATKRTVQECSERLHWASVWFSCAAQE